MFISIYLNLISSIRIKNNFEININLFDFNTQKKDAVEFTKANGFKNFRLKLLYL